MSAATDSDIVTQLRAGAPTVYVSHARALRLLPNEALSVEFQPFSGPRRWLPLKKSTEHAPLQKYRVKLAAQMSLPLEPAIDYTALIEAAYSRHKYAQGTKECVAFAKGAEWMLEILRKT